MHTWATSSNYQRVDKSCTHLLHGSIRFLSFEISKKNATLSNLTHGYPPTSRSHHQSDNDGDHDSDEGDDGGGGRVAPVVKVAEAPRRVVVVGALRVELLDTVERVLSELDVVGGGAAALVLVGGNVGAEALQVAQAVPRHHDVGALPLYQLDASVVRSGADLSPVPPRVEVGEAAAGVRPHALVADQAGLHARLEARGDLEQGSQNECDRNGGIHPCQSDLVRSLYPSFGPPK